MRYALLTCTDESAVISDEERSRRAAAVTRLPAAWYGTVEIRPLAN